jgi:hypothetical protein
MFCFPGRHIGIPLTLSEVVGCKEDRLAITRGWEQGKLRFGESGSGETLGVP